MQMRTLFLAAATLTLGVRVAYADDVVFKVQLVNEQGVSKDIGTVVAVDGKYGLVLTPQLAELSPGMHSFHVHEKADCNHGMKDGKTMAANAAGGHLDPAGTGLHQGPYGSGHVGDLPAPFVGIDGKATLPVLAPRLKKSDLKGRSLMIHSGADNYSDMPEKLGGGGARVACGLAK